jgi:hypothetical protein
MRTLIDASFASDGRCAPCKNRRTATGSRDAPPARARSRANHTRRGNRAGAVSCRTRGWLSAVAGIAVFRSFRYTRKARQTLRCVPVTIEAGTHCELRDLLNNIHVFHLSVAVHARDAAIHVNAVIEICVVRHSVNAFPGEGDAFLVVVRQFDDLRAILAGDGMAIHAD